MRGKEKINIILLKKTSFVYLSQIYPKIHVLHDFCIIKNEIISANSANIFYESYTFSI